MIINGKNITIPEKGLSSKEVQELFETNSSSVRKFASKNNVPYDGEGKRKTYHFFEDDIINFFNRPKPGRRW